MSTAAVTSIDATPSWTRATSLAPPASLGELFAAGAQDREALVFSAGDLLVDFSRQQVTEEILETLVTAASECGVTDALEQMLSGAHINSSENRAVGHLAMRMSEGEAFSIGGDDVVAGVLASLATMTAFAEGVRDGAVVGSTGRPFTTVLNIGIGGSDLGPRLIHEALRPLNHERISCRFVANVDPADLAAHLVGIDPAETLVIVSSKTFTTTETLINARAATNWIRASLGDDAVSRHVVAVSADERAVRASGLSPGIVFPLWDWVGGRFSIGSAVCLAALISVGPASFREFLGGLRDIDGHVQHQSLRHNAPLVMALIGLWNHSVLGYSTRAVIPYAHDLRGLPRYLQQLMMESNGKGVRRDGTPVRLPTSAVVWGDEGTNAQHAFMQLLHQGTTIVPVDFIGFARSLDSKTVEGALAQRTLFSNMVAQAQALAFGRAEHPGQPHRSFRGNRPSTVIVASELSPRTLGQIIALYEHAVFYEGVLLGINSFDQWGVELGKELASGLMTSSGSTDTSASGAGRAGARLMEWFESEAETRRD